MIKRTRFLITALAVLMIVSGVAKAQGTLPHVRWTKLIDRAVFGVSPSPDGKRIAYGDTKTGKLTVFDREANTVIWQTDKGGYYGEQSSWSPDGKTIATWLDPKFWGTARDVNIYNAQNGEHQTKIENVLRTSEDLLQHVSCCGELSGDYSYSSVRWSADSTSLAVLGYGYIVVYDLATTRVSTAINLNIPNAAISSFDWSPNRSLFAAYHLKRDEANNSLAVPMEPVIGFWHRDGTWLSQYDQANAQSANETCVHDGSAVDGTWNFGGAVAWAPDNQTIAASDWYFEDVSVCSLQENGKLTVKMVFDQYADQLRWSVDQKWLFGLTRDCSVYTADVSKDYTNHTQPFDIPGCELNSGGWSTDDHYLAIGTSVGLWLGTVTEIQEGT